MELTRLPEEVLARLPRGYEPRRGVRLVLPTDDGTRNSIVAVNSWMRDLDMYPGSLQSIVWFGEDGVGNFLGWDPGKDRAILWNPEDEEPWREGSVSELWQFVLNDYAGAA